MGKPIPPPPSRRTHSASPTDVPQQAARRAGGGVPQRFASGSHAAGDLQKGHVIPGEGNQPDRVVHSVTMDKDRVRVATHSGNQLPVVETFPANFRFTPKT